MPAPSMDKRQLFAICICFCLMVFEATLTLGVMPVHVVRLGADPAATGLYMAFSFFGATVGNILGGWLTDRIGQRKRIGTERLVWRYIVVDQRIEFGVRHLPDILGERGKIIHGELARQLLEALRLGRQLFLLLDIEPQ